MTTHNTDTRMKMKINPIYNFHHFTRRDRSVEAGPAWVCYHRHQVLSWPISAVCWEHLVRFRVWKWQHFYLINFFSEFSNILDYSQTSIAPSEVRISTGVLEWGKGLRETKSLRQTAKDPQFNQHQSCPLSLWRDPTWKAEIIEICQGKRSAQAPRNSIKITPPTSRAASLKLPHRTHSPAPVQPLNPTSSQPPTQSSNPPFTLPC